MSIAVNVNDPTNSGVNGAKSSTGSNALTGSKGVIQVNQVTGQGNQAVNMVSLPLAGAVTTSP